MIGLVFCAKRTLEFSLKIVLRLWKILSRLVIRLDLGFDITDGVQAQGAPNPGDNCRGSLVTAGSLSIKKGGLSQATSIFFPHSLIICFSPSPPGL